MNNFVSMFNEIYNKFMESFNRNVQISKNDNEYLNIIYSLKKISLTKFAEVAKITKPAATQIINKFIKKGYVIKNVSNLDKRVCYIELTPKLKIYFNDYYKDLNKMYDDKLSFLTKEERKNLDSILLKINKNLDNKKTNK